MFARLTLLLAADSVDDVAAGCVVPASALHRLHAQTEMIGDGAARSCTRAWLQQVRALPGLSVHRRIAETMHICTQCLIYGPLISVR